MVVPIGDAPNPRGAPVVTYGLIAVNIAVYALITVPLGLERPHPADPLLQEYVRTMSEAIGDPRVLREVLARISAYDLFVFAWGFRPAEPSLATLLVSMFLHGGLMHLVGNMLFLWIYGDNVEHRLGRGLFLLAYLGTGVAATLFHAMGDWSSPIPMVGASGAISGVLGFYFVWFPRNHVRLLWLLPPFVMQVFEVPARLVLGLYLLVDNLLPYLLVGGRGGGVAHGAHIGGFVAGLVAAWLSNRRALHERPTGVPAPAEAIPDDPRSARALIAAALDAGRMEEAAEEYFATPAAATRRFLSPAHAVALSQWLLDAGYPEAAVVVARRHLRDHARGPGSAEANVIAGEALLALGQPTPAYQHFAAALDQTTAPRLVARVRDGIAAIEALQKRQIGRLRRSQIH